MSKRFQMAAGLVLMLMLMPAAASAMHIMEGFLPPVWAISWGVISIPFVVVGLFSINKTVRENPRLKILLAMAGAFAFVLSALKIHCAFIPGTAFSPWRVDNPWCQYFFNVSSWSAGCFCNLQAGNEGKGTTMAGSVSCCGSWRYHNLHGYIGTACTRFPI